MTAHARNGEIIVSRPICLTTMDEDDGYDLEEQNCRISMRTTTVRRLRKDDYDDDDEDDEDYNHPAFCTFSGTC